MPSRARLLPLCAASLAVTLSGCASDRWAATAPPGVRLSGNWALDPAASDDIGQVVARLQAQIAKAVHVQRRTRPGGGFGGAVRRGPGVPSGDSDESPRGVGQTGQQASGPAGSGGAPPPGAALVQEFLSNVPGSHLKITVAPGSFMVASDDASQQYSPGIQTAVELGQVGAEQISGWKGQRYVIDTQPQWGPALTQTYRLAPDGRLVMAVRLRGDGIDAALTRRYERTKQAFRALLPTNN